MSSVSSFKDIIRIQLKRSFLNLGSQHTLSNNPTPFLLSSAWFAILPNVIAAAHKLQVLAILEVVEPPPSLG